MIVLPREIKGSERQIGSGEEEIKLLEVENNDAGLPVTQSDDPPSGGHFGLGASKAPPRSAREGSRIIIHIICALKLAHGKHIGFVVESKRSPISNGLTPVGGAKTRFLIYKIGHFGQRHKLPT